MQETFTSAENPSPLRRFAGRLIAFEVEGRGPGGNNFEAFHVCEKLRPQLSTLMGITGYHALLCCFNDHVSCGGATTQK